jgi:cytoskeletal protein RodZ
MQEQNFEKQVQKKMEELSFTPSEPVWRKVEEEIRKKKDRKRIFFWIVASLLLLAGGLWLVNKNRDTPLTTATKEIKQPDINSTKSFEKKIPIEKKQNPSSIVNTNDQKPNALQIPPKGKLLQKEQTKKGN